MNSQDSIYESLICKLDKIKDNINKIKEYSNETNNMKYLELLLKFSSELNDIESTSDDMFDMYILQLNPVSIKNQDLNLRKKLLINKHIEDVFMPYILYMQIMLLNA